MVAAVTVPGSSGEWERALGERLVAADLAALAEATTSTRRSCSGWPAA